jgi:hypothetical protein
MSESLPPVGASLVERFAERIATRDAPPAPDPHRFEPAQIEQRLTRAVAARLGISDARRQRNLGRMLYLFVEHPRLLRTELAEKLKLHPTSAAELAALLVNAGLLAHGWQKGRWHWYTLSRDGQDWALPIVKAEAPPAQ